FRLYTLFIGPPERDAEWDDRAVEGGFRFLNRVWKLFQELLERPDFSAGGTPEAATEMDKEVRRKTHQTIHKVTQDMNGGFKFNTAISAMMELINLLYDYKEAPDAKTPILREAVEALIKLLGPFTPHIAAEMWSRVGKGELLDAGWPKHDPALMKAEVVEIAIQVNGKLRGRVSVPVGLEEAAIRELPQKDEKIGKLVSPENILKVVWVKDKLANFIVKTS
ncbi:MAG TPA: class I tRNA ligase family protein, partial [bacterium]|nr:class I tRNA ligase family protein [bacterium]